MECLSQKIVKTRKPHHCHGCGDLFQPGSLLDRVVYVDDGLIASFYWCYPCKSFYHDSEIEDGISFGEFHGEKEYKEYKANLKQIEFPNPSPTTIR